MAFTSGYKLIFSHCGKTMIGEFQYDTGVSPEFTSETSVHTKLGITDGVYYVKNPAEIVFDLDVPASGSAQLKWEIKPLFYKDLTSDTDVFATYPKDSVVITNICDDNMNSLITAAYNDICG